MAATDPTTYLRALGPFDALPRELFEPAARTLEVSYFPAGKWLVRVGREPLQHLYVIRKGSVRLERDGKTLQILEEGEIFGYTSLLTGVATLDVVVEEDLVAYRLPEKSFRRLLADARFAGHFAVGLSERLKSSLAQSPVAGFRPDVSLAVEQLLRGPAYWVDAGATVGDAARVMSAARSSSVLVRGDPPGIVTDRDLRTRVLGAGLGPETPAVNVCSRPLLTLDASTPLYEAWTKLLDCGVHHFPVARRGEIVGCITDTDLLRATAHGPMALLRGVERFASRANLGGYAAKVSDMTAALLAGGLDATLIAGFVARLNDALVRRIVAWTEAEMGSAPVPYAWLALGSEGRMEQTLLTDQDNALVYADAGQSAQDWFRRFAERVNDDLEAAGFPPCPGRHMARYAQRPLSTWVREFRATLEEPRPHDAALYFDFRRVAGALDVEPLEAVLARSRSEPTFLRFLARQALQFSPPTMLLLRLKVGSSVDLKWHGVEPVVFLARCYGLEVGTRRRSTLDRLSAAAEAGVMAPQVWATVSEAYRFLLRLRLRLQLRSIADGQAPRNEVVMTDLTAHERTRLKESFRAVKRWQDKAAYHYQTDFV